MPWVGRRRDAAGPRGRTSRLTALPQNTTAAAAQSRAPCERPYGTVDVLAGVSTLSTVSMGKLVGGSTPAETCVLEQGAGECSEGEVGWAQRRPIRWLRSLTVTARARRPARGQRSQGLMDIPGAGPECQAPNPKEARREPSDTHFASIGFPYCPLEQHWGAVALGL